MPGLLEQHLGVIQQRLDVLAGLTGDEGDRHVPLSAERFVQVVDPLLRRHGCRRTDPTC